MQRPQRGFIGRYAYMVTLMLSLAATGCGGCSSCSHSGDFNQFQKDIQQYKNGKTSQSQLSSFESTIQSDPNLTNAEKEELLTAIKNLPK